MTARPLAACWPLPFRPGRQPVAPDAGYYLPCAQSMNSVTKHLYMALLVITCALVVSLNMPRPVPPIGCDIHSQQ